MRNRNQNHRNGFIHLYNPKKEGLSGYDNNYINASKNSKKTTTTKPIERYVAWFYPLEALKNYLWSPNQETILKLNPGKPVQTNQEKIKRAKIITWLIYLVFQIQKGENG